MRHSQTATVHTCHVHFGVVPCSREFTVFHMAEQFFEIVENSCRFFRGLEWAFNVNVHKALSVILLDFMQFVPIICYHNLTGRFCSNVFKE